MCVEGVCCSNEIKGGGCCNWGMDGRGESMEGMEISQTLLAVIKEAPVRSF